MRLVSPLLKKVVYPSIAKAGLFHRAAAGGLAVLTYHGVSPDGYKSIDRSLDGNLVTASQLRQQLRLLKAHYNVISPEQFLAWRKGEYVLPCRAVLLTCDDGLLNCLTDMLPLLQEQNMSCLFFVTGASAEAFRSTLWYEELLILLLRAKEMRFEIPVGEQTLCGDLRSGQQCRTFWWNAVKRLSRFDPETRAGFLREVRKRLGSGIEFQVEASGCRRWGLMMASELRELVVAGMAIGAHTMSHPILSQAPTELAYSEIAESRKKLQDVLGLPVWAFAYPFGDLQSVTPEVLKMPQRAGFEAACLNVGGGLGVALPEFALPRVHVTANMNLAEFEAHVCGFYGWLRRSARQGSAGTVSDGLVES
jgi:peptidoglycan/xylan/chitin deacetylase (PgdA/CDA1 family)